MRAVCASDLPPVAARVAIAIGLHLHVKSGRCDPGIDMIATGSRFRNGSVYRQIALLEKAGWIEVKRVEDGRGTIITPSRTLTELCQA